MNEFSIILSYRFKGPLPQMKAIHFFENLLVKWFGKVIDEINYTITDKSKYNWEQKTKNLKFTLNNLKKFENVVSEQNDTYSVDFELLKTLEKSVYKSRDIDFSILYNKGDNINSLNFIFNYALYKDVNWKSIVEKVAIFLNENNCKIVYGFLLNLENSKSPSLYIEGVSNYELHEEEEEKLNIWLNEMSKCDKKIWDIFWGNIVSLNLFPDKNKAIADIENIVGHENILFLTSDLIWFNLNENISNFNVLKYVGEKKELYDYFKNKKLILV